MINESKDMYREKAAWLNFAILDTVTYFALLDVISPFLALQIRRPLVDFRRVCTRTARS